MRYPPWTPPVLLPKDPTEPLWRNVATQRMCAAAHLNGSFADYAWAELGSAKHTGFAPHHGLINDVLLARHAYQSRWRRAVRDIQLFWVLGGIISGIAVSITLFLSGAVGAVGLLWSVLTVMAVGYTLGACFVWWHYRTALDRALKVFGDRDVWAEQPAPIPSAQEQFLAESAHADVVICSGPLPFPGCGEHLHTWSLTLSRRTGSLSPSQATDLDPREDWPDEFSSQRRFDTPQLYDFLLTRMLDSLDAFEVPIEYAGRDRTRDLPEYGDPRRTAPGDDVEIREEKPEFAWGTRLYVMGDYAEELPLFPRGPVRGTDDDWIRYRRPRLMLGPDAFQRYLRRPNVFARPYVWVRMAYPSGHLAVTMLLRTEVRDSSVFLEVSTFAIRPLGPTFADIWKIPKGRFAQQRAMLATVLPQVVPLLVGSPAPVLRLAGKPSNDAKAARELFLRLQDRRDEDYAAGRSVREHAGRENLNAHFFWMDEERWFQHLNRRALDVVREFLTEQNVPLAEFDRIYDETLRTCLERSRRLYATRA